MAIPFVASATESDESCPTQASLLPSAEKLTECTQPPPWGIRKGNKVSKRSKRN